MPIIVNCRIILSTSDYNLTKEIFEAVKAVVKKRFGEQSIVFDGVEYEPTETGLYFARIYLNLEKSIGQYYEVPERSGIKLKLKEASKDASDR
jgi:hypothetical protein